MEPSQINFDLGEVLTGLAMILGISWGAVWFLVQLSFKQFTNTINAKFDGFTSQIKNVQSGVDTMRHDVNKIELDIRERDATYKSIFVYKNDFKEFQQEIKEQRKQDRQEDREIFDKLFTAIQKIDDKIDEKMARN